MAFLKYRASNIIVITLFTLAVIGIIGNLIEDPIHVLKSIAAFLILGFVVFIIVRRLYIAKAGPKNREQQAFRKAAKKSQKRYTQKQPNRKSTSSSSLTTIKKHKNNLKKSSSHLTVIEGKKGKKKNRASF
ncbi:SA1362 family protein [Cytobacillus sp. Hz8]|uniref:SA1362 family protein n=1 Tax=Cytobacillus sp. Hz8 TaxID=3347168 RepID=UPI0035E3782E